MKKILLLFLLFSLGTGGLLAQNTITGKVTDANGEALIGATVVVVGQDEVGTVTDFDGMYELEVPEGATQLEYSYTGFSTQVVDIEGQGNIEVSLSEGVVLDQAVVTALGVSREKKTLGYAAQDVSSDEVTKVKNINFMNSLSGKVAGLDLKQSNSLGGATNVIIRGYTSLSGNNQALFVVDGTPINNTIGASSVDPVSLQIGSGNQQRTGRGGYNYGNTAMDINPEDIESMTVLKGAAATALYGSRAANGVILVETKQGKRKQGLGIEFTTGATWGKMDPSTFIRYQDEYGQGYSTYLGFYPGGDSPGLVEYDFGTGDGPQNSAPVFEDASFGDRFDPNKNVYQWDSYYKELDSYGKARPYVAAENDASAFYETSLALNNSIAFTGGNDDGNFRMSYTNYNTKGVLPNSKINRHNIFTSGSYDLVDNLTAGATAQYIRNDAIGRYGTGYDNRNVNQSFRQWYAVNTDILEQKAAYEQTGRNISWNPYGSQRPEDPSAPHYFDNYYYNRYHNYNNDTRNRLMGNMRLTYAVNDWINITGRMATDRYGEFREERIASESVDVARYFRENRDYQENNFDVFADGSTYFGATDNLSLDLLVGMNIRRTQFNSVAAKTNGGLEVPDVFALSNSASGIAAPVENAYRIGTNGFYGRANFGLNHFVYLDLAGRYDVTSTLPAGNNGYFYPSASLSFVFSELFDSRAISHGKFRANYAQVGNDAPYHALNDTYVLGGTPFNGVVLASAPATSNNPDLRPERTRNIELGLEMRFLQNRVGFDFTAYRANSFDQIMPVQVTAATGKRFQYVNAGEILNEGLEATINLNPVRSSNFNWDISVNWNTNRNEVVSLFGDTKSLVLGTAQGGISIVARVGESYGAIVGSNYAYDDDGRRIVDPNPFGGVKFAHAPGTEVIGNMMPDWRGGVQNSLSFKNLALSFLIDVQKGGDFFSLDTWYGFATGVYDITAGVNKNGNPKRDPIEEGGGVFIDNTVVMTGVDEEGYPISDGTVNEDAFWAGDVVSSLGYYFAPNAHHVYDASFVKLREVSLTYSLPRTWMESSFFKGIDISLTGRNLWIIHKNSPYSDPEETLNAGAYLGYQSGAYPTVREVGASVNFKF